MDSTSGAPNKKESFSPGQNLTAKPVQISSEIDGKKEGETKHRCCINDATRKFFENWTQVQAKKGSETVWERAKSASNFQLHFWDA